MKEPSSNTTPQMTVPAAQHVADSLTAQGERLRSLAQNALKPSSEAIEALLKRSQKAMNDIVEAASLAPAASIKNQSTLRRFESAKHDLASLARLDNPRTKPLQARIKMKGYTVHTAFDEYVLTGFLGEGGNGKVFSAKSSSGEQVAIKFLEADRSRTALKRFKNEISFCEADHGSHIVRVIDRGYAVFGDTGYSFCVMPLYKRSLRDLIREGLSSPQAIGIFVGILTALKTAHETGVVHRDVKPTNILFGEGSYEPVLCDFGIAKFPAEEMATIVKTEPGDRMANFQYAAPEQRKKGGIAVPQSDVYSTALILNEMFTREIPQAEGYKKIGDVDPSCSYLDELFASLYKQNPSERLYPVDAILSKMKNLADIAGRQAEVERLDRLETKALEPAPFSIKVVSRRFQDGMICFELNHTIPDRWFKILANGNYNHKYLSGYNTNSLRLLDKRTIGLRLWDNEGSETLLRIVRDIYSWIDSATHLYNEAQIAEAQERHRQHEMQRKMQIQKLRRENALNELLQNIQ